MFPRFYCQSADDLAILDGRNDAVVIQVVVTGYFPFWDVEADGATIQHFPVTFYSGFVPKQLQVAVRIVVDGPFFPEFGIAGDVLFRLFRGQACRSFVVEDLGITLESVLQLIQSGLDFVTGGKAKQDIIIR